MDIAARIREIRGELSQSEFARQLNIAQRTLSGYENGSRPPSAALLSELAQKYSVNINWLLTGVGVAYQTQKETPQSSTTPNPQPPLASTQGNKQSPHCSCDVDLLFVPRIKAQLSAGNGSLVTDDNIAGHYSFKSDWLHTKGQPKHMVILFVSGTSMQPEIYDNDMVMIDQSQTSIISGKTYAVGVDDAILVKYVDVAPGEIILRSKNQEFPPIHIERKNADQVKILGRVVWMAREY